MQTIRAVLLDADGVVQLPGAAWSGSLAALCGDPSRADEFRAEVFAAEKPCLTGAADFESALQEIRKWKSSDSHGPALQCQHKLRHSSSSGFKPCRHRCDDRAYRCSLRHAFAPRE